MIRTMIGAKEVYCPSLKAKLERDYKGQISGRNYLMSVLNDDNASVSIFNEQDDFVSLAAANSLVSVNGVIP
jgi:molybdopterin biosynthesis enzyme